MTRTRYGRSRHQGFSNYSLPAQLSSAITSRYAVLRRDQNLAGRLLMAAEIGRGGDRVATCRIAAARDRRTPFVWHPARRGR